MSQTTAPRWIRRLRLYLSMVGYANAHNQDFADEHARFFAGMVDYVGGVEEKRSLDVGCGKSLWLTLLLHTAGARVTGIDNEVVAVGRSPAKYLAIARRNGLERATRTFAWDLLYARPYYRGLAEAFGSPLRFDGLDMRSMSASKLDFPDDTFDLVVSHEVFEHLADLPGTVRALHRVMKPDGLTYIYVHSYTSLSGGHHIAWKYPDSEPSTVVPPWDHLRDRSHPEIPSWVNQLRERDYRAAFEERFVVLDWIRTEREGERLLTPEIRAELKDYDEDELLEKGFVIVARPR